MVALGGLVVSHQFWGWKVILGGFGEVSNSLMVASAKRFFSGDSGFSHP
jgi:hypothetical protein